MVGRRLGALGSGGDRHDRRNTIHKESRAVTHYRTAIVDGHKVFYREAGDPEAPSLLLLHGFPTSSHMFRDLIPLLADRYHVVAPDLLGFGFSDAPGRT